LTEASEDVIPTSSNLNQTFVNFTYPKITITYENPNHQPLACVDDTEVMNIPKVVITETQTFINLSPIIDNNLVLRSVCIEIFESMMELVEDRNKVMPSDIYIDKWNRLRKLVDANLDYLQEMVIASEQEALQEWFSEVCRSMDEVELRTCISRQIEYSELIKELEPAQEAAIPEVPKLVKSGLQGS